MPPKIRTVPTASGATAVQVIWQYTNRKPVLDHLGSAHTEEELALLTAQAQRLIDGDQLGLDLGISTEVTMPAGTGAHDNPVPITSEKAGHLIDAIRGAYQQLKLDHATDDDAVFFDLVAARLIHPGSKFESIETLAEVGRASASYRTIQRRLPLYATTPFRDKVTHALATYAAIGPGVMVLFDVTTLYFETDKEDDLRKPGFSKERRLEPQITVGLLSDARGFPLAIGAFEGNKAETHTMVPMIQRLRDAYGLDDITVVADAGMFSAGNKKAVVDAGLHYILGTKEREIPYPLAAWRKNHPDATYTDGQVWTYADRAGRGPDGIPHTLTYYQYSWDRARRTLKGIDEQIAKAERAVAGQVPVKRNRYVDLKAPNKQVNHALAEKHRALAGVKGYETSRVDLDADQVISAYRQLFKIEKAFRMAKSDLKARPIFHRKKDSIDAHLTIVMAAMATGHVLEQASGLSLKRLIRTLKKYRSFTIEVAGQTVHAQSPVPAEVQNILDQLPRPSD